MRGPGLDRSSFIHTFINQSIISAVNAWVSVVTDIAIRLQGQSGRFLYLSNASSSQYPDATPVQSLNTNCRVPMAEKGCKLSCLKTVCIASRSNQLASSRLPRNPRLPCSGGSPTAQLNCSEAALCTSALCWASRCVHQNMIALTHGSRRFDARDIGLRFAMSAQGERDGVPARGQNAGIIAHCKEVKEEVRHPPVSPRPRPPAVLHPHRR